MFNLSSFYRVSQSDVPLPRLQYRQNMKHNLRVQNVAFGTSSFTPVNPCLRATIRTTGRSRQSIPIIVNGHLLLWLFCEPCVSTATPLRHSKQACWVYCLWINGLALAADHTGNVVTPLWSFWEPYVGSAQNTTAQFNSKNHFQLTRGKAS